MFFLMCDSFVIREGLKFLSVEDKKQQQTNKTHTQTDRFVGTESENFAMISG